MLYLTRKIKEENEEKFKVNDVQFDWDSIYSNEEMIELIKEEKDGLYEAEEIMFITKYRIAFFYNLHLEQRFRNSNNSNMPIIYKRQTVFEYIEDLPLNGKGVDYLMSLVYSGIITNCGSGYLFDGGRIKISEEEREKAREITWRKYMKSA